MLRWRAGIGECLNRGRNAERGGIRVSMARVRNDVFSDCGVHMGRGNRAVSWCFGI